VLGLVVTTVLYEEFPDQQEGRLAKLRAAAVKTAALARVARDLRLGDHVRLGKGEASSGGADKDSILADTFEALLGAVYLDRGYDVAAEVLERLFRPRLRGLAMKGAALDYKTSLQELVASRYESVPTYELADEGPDHDKHFTAAVLVDGEVRGRGTGGSKKKAEQAAAREAYRSLISDDRDDGAASRSGHQSEEGTGARAP
jgi:ribonuclease III